MRGQQFSIASSLMPTPKIRRLEFLVKCICTAIRIKARPCRYFMWEIKFDPWLIEIVTHTYSTVF